MKQFFKYIFASFLGSFISVAFFIIFLIGLFSVGISTLLKKGATESQVGIENHSVIKIDLSDPISEQNNINPLAGITGGGSSLSLRHILNAIETAANDNRIDGIYLSLDNNVNNIATNEQIRNALSDFKQSHKFIYAYANNISQGAYFVGSIADSVFLNPVGDFDLKGLAAKLTFFKGAMDKLGVKPEIFYCGQFKSATEPYRLGKMSEPNRIQMNALLGDIWNSFANAASLHAHCKVEDINQLATLDSIQSPQDALKAKLIDGAWYQDQVTSLINNQTGQANPTMNSYVEIKDYLKSGDVKDDEDSKSKIAYLVAEGDIVDGDLSGNSAQIAEKNMVSAINKIRNDNSIKIVVMRVNSPGGSAQASENIHRALVLLKQKKQVIVSMGDYAASGGYYISCIADKIFALPNTVTGSIGVFGMSFNTENLFTQKLGITFDMAKTAPHADLPNMNREMTDDEKAKMQNGVNRIYGLFKQRVSEGRHISVDYVDSIGQGRVWTGLRAKELGLVDTLGGLKQAFEYAAKLSGLGNDYDIVEYPKVNGSIINRILGNNASTSSSQEAVFNEILEKRLGINSATLVFLKNLDANKSHLWMMMPFVPDFN